ncbi:hypothetical protein E6C27_scaffold175G001740 [Cucumis melo var. makuwa]|uniref:Uncharacterized protein n=1 Tax=Cucumis melo var. makuwa TaxID=1194695 RepID=A0A5A7U5I5_CUCMM|nr:hypothetical protein E6C27_scaffold175G001740 [Cucumis melo var. makuwa]
MEERRLNQIRGVQNGSTNRLRLKPYKENSKGAGWAKSESFSNKWQKIGFHLEPYIGMELIGKGLGNFWAPERLAKERILVITGITSLYQSRLYGAGYHVLLKWWIGRGMPLNAYLRGQIVLMLVREHKLKELRLVPSDFFTRKATSSQRYDKLEDFVPSIPVWLNFVQEPKDLEHIFSDFHHLK